MGRTLTDCSQHHFRDTALRARALTHRSAAAEHNERLEFLGDGLVNLIVAEALYRRFPDAAEGWLTQARSQLVCETALATIARSMDLGPQLRLGAGEVKAGGAERDSILADAVEAMAAAIHLDAGYEACRRVVLNWLEPGLDELQRCGIAKDAKTRLQEWLQARGLPLPEYALVDSRGEEHDKTFEVACRLREPVLEASAEGHSRRQAEQQAAHCMLGLLAA